VTVAERRDRLGIVRAVWRHYAWYLVAECGQRQSTHRSAAVVDYGSRTGGLAAATSSRGLFSALYPHRQWADMAKRRREETARYD